MSALKKINVEIFNMKMTKIDLLSIFILTKYYNTIWRRTDGKSIFFCLIFSHQNDVHFVRYRYFIRGLIRRDIDFHWQITGNLKEDRIWDSIKKKSDERKLDWIKMYFCK